MQASTGRPPALLERFAAVARAAPASPALGAHGRTWTHRRLLESVAATADALALAGCETGPIAVAVRSAPAFVISTLAASSKAAVLPVDTAMPKAALADLFERVRPAFVVIDSADPVDAAVAAAMTAGAGVVAVGNGAVTDAERPVAPAAHDPGPGILLQTSGTTGTPKLVHLDERRLLAAVDIVADALALTPEDRCLSMSPLFHSLGVVTGLLVPLLTGGYVERVDPRTAPVTTAWLTGPRPTWYSTVPALHRAIVDRVDQSWEGGPLPMRFVRSSAAPLPADTQDRIELDWHIPVVQAYALTEAPGQVTATPLHGDRRRGSVGLAAPGRVRVVDEAGATLQDRVGAVEVRGPNVAQSFWSPDGDSPPRADGWTSTGDLGLIAADGHLTICGRVHDVVNRGGEKVLPYEAERALLSHPDVVEAVAFAVPHRVLGEDLAAAVTLRPGALTTPAELRALLGSLLSSSAIPHRLLRVERMPVGRTGKVDRAALRELACGRSREAVA